MIIFRNSRTTKSQSIAQKIESQMLPTKHVNDLSDIQSQNAHHDNFGIAIDLYLCIARLGSVQPAKIASQSQLM